MDQSRLREVLAGQDGVVSRRQVLEAAFDDGFIECRLRRREWARVHRGVYVDHTGPLTWTQRAWAAVLWAWPAALARSSALGPEPEGRSVHVAIDQKRRVVDTEGVVVHRVVGLAPRVQWNATPPRVRFEEAVVDLCADARDATAVVALVADACRSRRTTQDRLLAVVERRTRLRNRRWVLQALGAVAGGVTSVLEHGYLRRVERAHGLPRAERQVMERTEDGVVYRDVLYEAFGLLVELDGRLGHEWTRDRWADMDRDLLAATESILSLRLGWRQVEEAPCRTAARLGQVLRARGWAGRPRPCGPTCAVRAERGSLPA